jgi:hypothetical protein
MVGCGINSPKAADKVATSPQVGGAQRNPTSYNASLTIVRVFRRPTLSPPPPPTPIVLASWFTRGASTVRRGAGSGARWRGALTGARNRREALEGPPARRLGTLGCHSCWRRAVRAGPLRADNLRWPGTGADGRLQGFPIGDAEPQRVGPGDRSRRARAPRGCSLGSGPTAWPTGSDPHGLAQGPDPTVRPTGRHSAPALPSSFMPTRRPAAG